MKLLQTISDLESENFLHEARIAGAKSSPDYEKLSKEVDELNLRIKELQDKQRAMLPESDVEIRLSEARKELINGLIRGETYEGVQPKYKEKKEVNQTMLLEALGGDFGIYQELSSVTQKALKDFTKKEKRLSKVLNNCIQVTSRTIVDYELINNK